MHLLRLLALYWLGAQASSSKALVTSGVQCLRLAFVQECLVLQSTVLHSTRETRLPRF